MYFSGKELVPFATGVRNIEVLMILIVAMTNNYRLMQINSPLGILSQVSLQLYFLRGKRKDRQIALANP